MTLSTWFRDYVYIPLGGNRCGLRRQIINILIVWILTGIWHGASWNFVLWGLYFGVILIIEKYVIKNILEKTPKVLKHLYALILIIIGWVIFAANDLSGIATYLQKMFINGKILDNEFIFYLKNYFWFILFGILLSTPILSKIKMNKVLEVITVIVYIVLFLLTIALLVSDSYNPFLYFRF